MPRFPPQGSPGWRSPVSQVLSRHCDFLLSVPPCFVAVAWRYHGAIVGFVSLTEVDGPVASLGLGVRYPRPAVSRGDDRISQVPGEPSLPFAHDPRTPDGRLGPHLDGPHRVAPAGEKTKAPTMMVISGLNSMAFEIAVYASQPGLPQSHARLASRCWLDFPGQA